MEKAQIGNIFTLWVTCLIFFLFNQIGKFILVTEVPRLAPPLIPNTKSNLVSFYNTYWSIWLDLLRNTVPEIKVIRLSTMATTKGICCCLSGVNKRRAVSLNQQVTALGPQQSTDRQKTCFQECSQLSQVSNIIFHCFWAMNQNCLGRET